ncbi:Xaa-Pro peptidase family protein [Microbacterium sp. MPKO10]|uniref:M24 family metallopeptidase n=1 Tax=Microbacterium sp. MPKO10 TaxID=2989818 RepID=UPI00223681AD|nr:M24 family metallopeptidase [Microbacterium sp. MPKO10]MCW4456971.1 M24 family metallopeptidase [Microbacterium sp. MPKO10]
MSDGATEQTQSADRAQKRAAVRALLTERDAESVLLTSAAAVNWYLDGARTHVSLAGDPIVAVAVDHDRDAVLITSNEHARLVAEELPTDLEVVDRPWFEPLAQATALTEKDVDSELRALRAVLSAREVDRFSRLGADAAHALTRVLTAADPTWTERQLAARVASELVETGSDPLVVLVAGAGRPHPHPLPTDAPLGRRAMVVVCARRHGLIANLTRSIVFGRLTDDERDAQARILEVESHIFDATAPGRPLNDVLGDIADAYPACGFAADQWRAHHQGGAAGYAGRDPRATPDTADRVQLGQAFAWNPWADGAKVEDTVLLTGSEQHPVIQPLTVDHAWPVTTVAGRLRPVTLER